MARHLADLEVFKHVRRPAYLHVDLDVIENNLKILRNCANNPDIEVMAVVKGNAYGHGAVAVARHLKCVGVERLAVATVTEGVQLRRAGIRGPLHIFGNSLSWEMEDCVYYNLLPTVCTEDTVRALGELLTTRDKLQDHKYDDEPAGRVHIKLDTGLSRYGCSPQQLNHLVQVCRQSGVTLEGIFTHLIDATKSEVAESQMSAFYEAIQPYRSEGLLFHVANSDCVIRGVGTELDIIRPGAALYGLLGGFAGSSVEQFEEFGFRPAASVLAQATLVKQVDAGQTVGYGNTYTCDHKQWVVTLPVGYADGYWRQLGNKGYVQRQLTGELCAVIGTLSMDSMTVRVSGHPPPQLGDVFIIVTSDFDDVTSVTGLARLVGSKPLEVVTRLNPRLPRHHSSTLTSHHIRHSHNST